MDVFRLNFSHGDHRSHKAAIDRIRRAAQSAGRTVAILQDLSGPKIRTGRLAGRQPVKLSTGGTITIEVGDFEGGPGRISTTFAALPSAVKPGAVLLLDDGRLQLEVQKAADGRIDAVVRDGGELGEHKGINVPGVELPVSGLTPKDEEDLRFGISAGVDFVALSFVQTPDDLERARSLLRDAGAAHIPLVAKLERPQAIARLDAILRASDAVMVARGDLGLELPFEQVPRIQKQVTTRARVLGVPVIVATQVLESMRTEPRPTRAEVSDAANAVDDRVDAIMLAGETAIGAHPVRAVETLDMIVRDAESLPAERGTVAQDTHTLPPHGHAICEAACTLAQHSGAVAIVAVTRGGKTARVLSALRPRAPIVSLTDQEAVARRLALAWGVHPFVADLGGDMSTAATRVRESLIERGIVPVGALVVIVSVTPDLVPGPSNFLKLQRL